MGYLANIEEKVLGSRGIDVALKKGSISIACEICITTDDQHELENVRKCLEAGYLHVAVVSPEPKRLTKLKAAIESKLTAPERQRVRFVGLEELFSFIQELDIGEMEKEKTVRGYKVKTNYQPLDAEQSKQRRGEISGIVAKAVKRLQEHPKTK
jgi:hypothetical protein